MYRRACSVNTIECQLGQFKKQYKYMSVCFHYALVQEMCTQIILMFRKDFLCENILILLDNRNCLFNVIIIVFT